MNHASLFSGIGGFDLAAHWMGWNNVFNCDIEEFPRKVLKHHFPHAIQYADIKQTDFTIHAGQIDILSGGFPCQPFSVAGKRLGKNDERHLWPEMYRAIQEIRPKWIVGENVRGLLNWSDGLVLDEVYTDLENEGYEVESFVLPAAGINAPHKRDRVWIIASNSKDCGRRGRTGEKCSVREWSVFQDQQEGGEVVGQVERYSREQYASNSNSRGGSRSGDELGEPGETRQGWEDIKKDSQQFNSREQTWEQFPTQSPVCGGDDGIPRELDSITFPKWRRESIKAYGNAIVPQIAYRIFRTIDLIEKNL